MVEPTAKKHGVGLPLQVLEGHEAPAVDLAHLERLDDVGVIEAGREARFVQEHRTCGGEILILPEGDVLPHHLEREELRETGRSG